MSPLVILPGWGHGRESWEPLVAKCAPREVRIFELPGFGSEPLVSSDWGIPQYAAWVRSKLEPLSASRFALLGHSFGGRIAAVLASEGVDGLASLVLYGAPVLYRPTITTNLRILAAKVAKPLFAPFRSPGSLIGSDLADAEARGMGAIFRKTVGFDQGATLPAIRVPTLLLSGTNDSSVPLRITQEAHGLIPGSELLLLPGLGHNAHQENPTLFCGAVLRFLDKHEHPVSIR